MHIYPIKYKVQLDPTSKSTTQSFRHLFQDSSSEDGPADPDDYDSSSDSDTDSSSQEKSGTGRDGEGSADVPIQKDPPEVSEPTHQNSSEPSKGENPENTPSTRTAMEAKKSMTPESQDHRSSFKV